MCPTVGTGVSCGIHGTATERNETESKPEDRENQPETQQNLEITDSRHLLKITRASETSV